MVDVILYDPKLTTLKVGAVIATPSTASSFYAQVTDTVSGGITKWLKDIKVSGIDAPMELVNFLGKDSNSFQNQALEPKPFKEIRVSGTLAYSPVDTDLSVGGLIFGVTGTTIGSGKSYKYGSGSRTAKALGVQFTDGTRIISLGFNNIYGVKLGEISQASDSHVECPFEMVCLIKDFQEFVEA
jgi:hypothetical protein